MTTPKNGVGHTAEVSLLGRELRKIAEKIAASGAKPLNRREVAREVSERRGGRGLPSIRTFLGVLITAACSRGSEQEAALAVLEDPTRVLLATPFLALEVVPKAPFHRQKLELSFYEHYLASAAMYRGLNRIEQVARAEAGHRGMAALDALHVAAAFLLKADEFITTEKPSKPIYRTTLVRVRCLYN